MATQVPALIQPVDPRVAAQRPTGCCSASEYYRSLGVAIAFRFTQPIVFGLGLYGGGGITRVREFHDLSNKFDGSTVSIYLKCIYM